MYDIIYHLHRKKNMFLSSTEIRRKIEGGKEAEREGKILNINPAILASSLMIPFIFRLVFFK